MRSAARIGDKCGGVIITGASTVTVNSSPLAHINSKVSPHAHGSHTHVPVIATGSSTVIVEGKPASRIGDKATCVHKITTGSSNVFIGG